MGIYLAGEEGPLRRLALKRRSGGREARLSERRIERLRDDHAPLPAGGLRSAIGVATSAAALRDARFEVDGSISGLESGLERRFALLKMEAFQRNIQMR
jgi:hypothetical protein